MPAFAKRGTRGRWQGEGPPTAAAISHPQQKHLQELLLIAAISKLDQGCHATLSVQLCAGERTDHQYRGLNAIGRSILTVDHVDVAHVLVTDVLQRVEGLDLDLANLVPHNPSKEEQSRVRDWHDVPPARPPGIHS